MASFIGSNLQSLHYNFKHKVAGSTVENPLKIYSGSVNPSNLPAPTSNEWKEIKNQNFIDRLSQQDGNTVVETTSNSVLGNVVSTNAPCDGMMNIEIGGLTLKNEVVNSDFSNGTEGWDFGGITSSLVEGNILTLVKPINVYPNTLSTGCKSKLGDKIYLSAKCKANEIVNNITINYRDLSAGLSLKASIKENPDYTTFVKTSGIVTITTQSNDGGIQCVFNYPQTPSANPQLTEPLIINLTAMFGAGNEPSQEWCDANITYFDGVKSVGELEGNKIEVLSRGSNLLKFTPKTETFKGVTLTVKDNGEYTLNGTAIESANFTLTYCELLSSYYTLKANNTDIPVNNPNSLVQLYDSKNNQILSVNNNTPIGEYAVKYLEKGIFDLRVRIEGGVTYSNFVIKPQLNIGTKPLEYAPYREGKLDILNGLRGLPNGAKDTASGDTAERKIGKMILDGSESGWILKDSDKTNTILFGLVNKIPYKIPASDTIDFLCDKIPPKKVYGIDEEGCFLAGVYNWFYIRVAKSKLTTPYLVGFKSWLQANPVTVYYELAEPIIEKLPQPLTLQSFANGTLQVNTAIPAYIKEYHTTNPDDQGVMQYQSGTTGLSQAFLTQIPLTSITNDIFGGSLPALKSAYKLTSNCDISAYGSGSNNDIETNNMTYRVWNGTEYVLLNTSTSDVVSNINNILNNNNYVVDNNIYILMYTLPASDTIKSQINLDYFNANIDITRQPDNVIIPDTVKNTYIPTNYTIFAKVACLKTNNKKVISQYFKDTNNYIALNIENNKINFIKCINGVITTLSSNVLDYNKYQVVGIVAQQQNTGMKLSVLKNNGECEHFSNTDVNLLNVATEWKLGHDINITNQLDGFILDYQFANKTFTNTECEVMLKGRNTTGDITYDSFVKDYQNGRISNGFILPNNKYKITGQAKLYYNDNYSRTIQDCEFVAKDDENKIELVGMAELIRVD